MGNENSQLSGLEIEDKAVEITEFWQQYQATIKDSCRYFSLKGDGSVSVFKGEAAAGPLWAVSTPLEKFCNNLLKYRHPCIVRYISAWQQRSTLHLATEYVLPLSHVLKTLSPLQICIGLNNILRALVFLHDQASMSHNNVSTSAVYVTGDGQWKLGGLQYLCPFSELTPAYLKHARIHRYDKAIDPNEDSNELTTKVDQYGFAVLVEDVLKGQSDDEVPYLTNFKKYCKDNLKNEDPTKRSKLSEVLQHNFFNHTFISIYKFLTFLPLKSEDERSEFFTTILNNLKCYDEETVAKQLSGLLLSRLTMLDATARREVIPYILEPCNERQQNSEHPGFFSLNVFKEHVKPRLLQLFSVRDSQIRMLLLMHFSKYIHVFTHEELSQHILPELLLGIKDTDDNLVASTLICLSVLVPILGAAAVVGGKRSKYFTDGRPNCKNNLIKSTSINKQDKKVYLLEKSLRELPCSEDVYENDNTGLTTFTNINLNERPTPVGGESLEEEVILRESTINQVNSEEDWSDWDNTNRQLTMAETESISIEADTIYLNTEKKEVPVIETNVAAEDSALKKSLLQKAAIDAKRNIVDISELDIKHQKTSNTKKGADEFDFFADMKPVIEKAAVVSIDDLVSKEFSSKLTFVPDENQDENEGWGENWND